MAVKVEISREGQQVNSFEVSGKDEWYATLQNGSDVRALGTSEAPNQLFHSTTEIAVTHQTSEKLRLGRIHLNQGEPREFYLGDWSMIDHRGGKYDEVEVYAGDVAKVSLIPNPPTAS